METFFSFATKNDNLALKVIGHYMLNEAAQGGTE